MLVADDGGFAWYITRPMMDRIRDDDHRTDCREPAEQSSSDGAAPVFGCVQDEVLHGIREEDTIRWLNSTHSSTRPPKRC